MKNLVIIAIIGFISTILSQSNIIDTYENLILNSGEMQQYCDIHEFSLSTDKIYLAVNGEEKIDYNLKYSGNLPVTVSCLIEDKNVCTIDDNLIVRGVSPGTTTLVFYANDKKASVEVVVTDLITTIPSIPNPEKELINGKTFTKEENDLLDSILTDRVNKAGYKTRAGTVAAVRFLCLEFPYRIPYFSENGRLDTYGWTNYVDGEGRYYHKGLYLNDSRYANLSKSMYGPGTWGTYIYSIPSKGKRANGFDCSGFITWIVYNGGFEPGDVGAGITSIPDITDLGKKLNLKDSIANNKLKAGDLLSGKGSSGGHIAFVAGITEDKYYIAESLWAGTGYFGAIIRTYEHDKLTNNFYWHIDMDEFYGADGNYTAYWK